MTLYRKIWLLCCRGVDKFTRGKTYTGKRLDSDTWDVIDDSGKETNILYSLACPLYFFHAFFESDFKNVCNMNPDLITPVPFEWDCTFNWSFDNYPDAVKQGERTVDSINVEEAQKKIEKLWPNVRNFSARVVN